MNVPSLLTETVRRGIALEAHGDTLRYDAPAGTMTTELKDCLREHKAELLRLLSRPAEAVMRLHPYHYRLKDGKGGDTYLTPAATLEEARDELLRRWPDELLVVTRAGQRC